MHVCTSGNGEKCDIYCETTDHKDTISFTHPQYGSAGACASDGSCGSGLRLGYSVSRINSTFTRLTIPSLNCTTDKGNWTCSYGNTDSTPAPLPCPTSAGNGTQIKVNGKNVTCQLNCQSPISAFPSLQMHYIQEGKTFLLHNVTSISGSTPSAVDGCSNDEQNVILTRDVSSSDICGSVKFKCIFSNIYLGTVNSSESADVSLGDYNWHILIGWIIVILIILIAGFICFMIRFVKKKHSGGSDKKSDGMSKNFKILVGVGLGVGVVLSLIICIIIATQVCLSQFGTALGIGIGVSFGIMFICVVIIAIVYFNYMKDNAEDKLSLNTLQETSAITNTQGRRSRPYKLPPIKPTEPTTSKPKKGKKVKKNKVEDNETEKTQGKSETRQPTQNDKNHDETEKTQGKSERHQPTQNDKNHDKTKKTQGKSKTRQPTQNDKNHDEREISRTI